MDEVGLMVVGIDSDGLLHGGRGGVDRGCSCPSSVCGRRPPPRVIGSKPIHLLKAEDMDRANDMDSLYADIGAKNKEDAEKLVKLGDQIVLPPGANLRRGFLKARLWTTGLVATPLSRRSEQHDFDLVGAFTVQEEVGLRCGVAAIRLSPI